MGAVFVSGRRVSGDVCDRLADGRERALMSVVWSKETYYLWRWVAPCGCGYTANQGINEPPIMKRYDDGFQVQVDPRCKQAKSVGGGQVLIYSNDCPNISVASNVVEAHQTLHGQKVGG